MTVYRCTFDRIGRNHAVPPQDFVAENAQELANNLYSFVRKFVMSSEVEVLTNLEEGKGSVVVGGFRPAGDFTIEQVPA